MYSLTTNYGLKKPIVTDFYDIEIQNLNMDCIDTKLKELEDNTSATRTVIGDNTTLNTTDKSTLVSAINEINTAQGSKIPLNIFTSDNDFIIGNGAGSAIKKTLAEIKTLLGVNAATTSATGVIELATSAECSAGTDTSRAVTPAGLKAVADTKEALIYGVLDKITPVNADTIPISDSQASNATKKVTWLNIKNALKSFFDGYYSALGHTHSLSSLGALASSSYTASDVKAKLLTVDGAGSGVDADKIKGQNIFIQSTQPSSPATNDLWFW